MKKIINILLITGIFCVIITGCNKVENDKSTETDFQNFIKEQGFLKNDIVCDEIKNVVSYAPTIIEKENHSELFAAFITKDGSLYQLSYNQLFSNHKNCKKIENDTTFKRFLTFINGDDNDDNYNEFTPKNIVGLINDQGSLYNLINYENEPYDVKLEFKGNITDLSNKTFDSIYLDNIILFEDENIFPVYNIFEIKPDEITKVNEVSLDSLLNDEYNTNNSVLVFEENELLEYAQGNIVKTNKNFYIYEARIKNQECEKYADVQCISEKKFYPFKDFSKQINNIQFFMNYYTNIEENDNIQKDILIDKNGNLYSRNKKI